MLAEAAGASPETALARATANLNKIQHIFGKSAHNLDKVVDACGSKGKALQELIEAGGKNFPTGAAGAQEFEVTVQGIDVTVRGIVINGQFNIGTAFIP